MGRRAKRHWKFQRNPAQDRVYQDWFGSGTKPHVTEGMAHVEVFLQDLAKEVGLRDGVTIEKLNETWAKIAGENIALHSTPIEIYQKVLKVRVSQPVIKFELQQYKSQLLENIRRELPGIEIRDMRLVI